MKPIKTENTNKTFVLSGGTKENNLPACASLDEHGAMRVISTWDLDDEERDAIANGARIELCVWGVGHPPVSLAVE